MSSPVPSSSRAKELFDEIEGDLSLAECQIDEGSFEAASEILVRAQGALGELIRVNAGYAEQASKKDS